MPVDVYVNGDDGCSEGVVGSDDSEAEDEAADEYSLEETGAPARALAALNALRKSRQHYDVVLVAQGGEEPAHRAVLAAASPYLLRVLPAAAPPTSYRLPDVTADALRPLLDYAYTGRLAVRDTAHALALYRAAWRLRLEPPRLHLASRLVRRLEPASCLAVRALPDLPDEHRTHLDAFIAARFDDVCRSGALASLPEIRIEMMRETSLEGGEEGAMRVADAALAWLLTTPDVNFEQLCSRTHLVYVDSSGSLRDCGELPATNGDAPELQQYRKEAAARKRGVSAPPTPGATPGADPALPPDLELGGREARGTPAVLASRPARAGGARALLALRGQLAAARVSWSSMAAGTAALGGALGGADAAPGERRAPLPTARAALGLAALQDRLLAAGGYDRSRVHGSCEAYDPLSNTWRAAADMRAPRARFPAAALREHVYVLGGSDGHAELDSVEAWSLKGGAWAARARLPLAVSHAAAAADARRGVLYAVGGWAAGAHLRRVLRYDPNEDKWEEAPPLVGARAQAAAVVWDGALWALGGCDAWHCLATTERLLLAPSPDDSEGSWAMGPPLPTARRSVGAATWRGRLLAAGGSDGAASLRRTEWLLPGEAAWRAGPALRRARAALGLAVLHDALYAAGGFDGKEFLASVECLYHPDGEWTELRDPPRLPALVQDKNNASEVREKEDTTVKEKENNAEGKWTELREPPRLPAVVRVKNNVSEGRGMEDTTVKEIESEVPRLPSVPIEKKICEVKGMANMTVKEIENKNTQ